MLILHGKFILLYFQYVFYLNLNSQHVMDTKPTSMSSLNTIIIILKHNFEILQYFKNT